MRDYTVLTLGAGDRTVISSAGIRGPQGPTGATGATGATGPNPFDGTSLTAEPRALVVKAQGAVDVDDLPLGRDGSAPNGLILIGSLAGGEDESGGVDTDTTARINVYAYQRAEATSYGEILRAFLMENQAKAMLAWYLPSEGFDANGDPVEGSDWDPVAWVGAHWAANDDPTDIRSHAHISIEVPDSAGALQTRLEIPFIDKRIANPTIDDIGADLINIRTNNADFTVTSNQEGGVLRVGGTNAYNKDIEFSDSIYRGEQFLRWLIRCDNTTEVGSNVGSDFRIRRFADDGTILGSALFIRRQDGNIALGQATAESARVAAVWATSGHHGFYAKPSTSPGSGGAFAALLTAITDRLVDLKVGADANSRFVILGDGKTEWGSGSAARDVSIERSAAGLLRVNGDLAVTGVGQTQFVRKTADESVTASTTFQDDDHLTSSVVANGIYEVSAMLIYDAPNTGDMKLQFAGPSGASFDWSTQGPHSDVASPTNAAVKVAAQTIASQPSVGALGVGTKLMVHVRGLLVVGATPGTFKLQWAQNTSDPAATTIYTNSYLKLTRVA